MSAHEIAEFQARAGEVARLAPTADDLHIALAANSAFALVAGFLAHYDTRVPAPVTSLDHFDVAAKLQPEAGGGAALRAAVQDLHRTWSRLRPLPLSWLGSAPLLVLRASEVRRQRSRTALGCQVGWWCRVGVPRCGC